MLNLPPFAASLGAPPPLTGPAAEKVVQEFLAVFQKLADADLGHKKPYLPEVDGLAETWVDAASGDEAGNYIPMTLADSKRLDDAVESLILISKPVTGAGVVQMAKENARPGLGNFNNVWQLRNQTLALLSHWGTYKSLVAKKTPWGWIIAITFGVGATVLGGYWYQRRYSPSYRRVKFRLRK